ALAPGGRMATTYQPRGRNPSAAQTDEMARTCEDLARAAGFAGIETHVLPLKPVPAVCIIARK
ncbi:MAG: hypothetical protein R3C58_08810, partial [Parvularculaceae bacterium]